MKRYGNLYESICDIDNIKLAHKNARKGKTHYKEVKEVDANIDYYCNKIKLMLESKEFRNSTYTIFTKNDKGKKREIYKLPYFPDRIIHHAIVQVLETIWKNTLIKDTYQSIKGRGLHKAVKKIQTLVHNSDTPLYYLKIDINKFYPSINNLILKQVIRKKIKCKDTLWLLEVIIDSTRGVPIGNYLSQYFGNLYLSSLDHKVKEYCRAKYYYRYCDDIVVIHSTKFILWFIFSIITSKLTKLALRVKPNYCLRPITNKIGLDFLGVVIYANYSKIRRRIKYNFIKQIKYFNNLKSLASYKGWLMLCDSYNLTKKYNFNY